MTFSSLLLRSYDFPSSCSWILDVKIILYPMRSVHRNVVPWSFTMYHVYPTEEGKAEIRTS